jgi:chemotaxis signal transduction protein
MKTKEFLVFEVAGREFGLPLSIVEEVVPASQITPIPNSPPFLLGLASIRGKIMGVIDASRRYGIGPSLNTHFMVCRVRGNLTAVSIDRPVFAGTAPLRELNDQEKVALYRKNKVNAKFLRIAYELMEKPEENAEPVSTGHNFFEIDPDLFVSAEMASRVGEA